MRLLVSALLFFALTGCQSNGGSDQATTESAAGSMAQPAGDVFAGKVIETMDAGGYTYVKVDTGTEQIWAAGPQHPMAVGTAVQVSKAMPMQDFHSDTLERTFDTLYFVTDFGGHETVANPHGGAMSMGSTGAGAQIDAGNIEFDGIEAADQTVAMVYASKSELAGQTVRVRGKVVKSLSGIMGTNWLHIQDGTGEAGSDDLTVTTSGTAPVGATVLIEGPLAIDRDFGSGYSYAVIVEDAKVTIE